MVKVTASDNFTAGSWNAPPPCVTIPAMGKRVRQDQTLRIATLFGGRLKRWRRHHRGKLTQQQVAEQADIATSMVSQVETGKKKLSLETLDKIAKVYGTTAGHLLDYEPTDPPIPSEFLETWRNASPEEQKIIIRQAKALVEKP